jgi:hypothetical protein
MRWDRRLAQLERQWPPPPPILGRDRRRQRQWHCVVRRYERLFDQAVELLPAEEQEQVCRPMLQYLEEGRGPYRDWLEHLSKAWCRLPELPATVMKDLLLAWLSPAVDGSGVCQLCGLEHPKHKAPPLSEWKLLPGKQHQVGPPPWYDLPAFFRSCPNCGGLAHEIDWPHQTEQYERPWQGWDGCVSMAGKRR